ADLPARFGCDCTQAQDGGLSLLRADARQDQDEFVSTHTGDVIVLAASLFEILGYDLQQAIALQMSETVINLLKAVQVTNQHGQRSIQPTATRQFAIQM